MSVVKTPGSVNAQNGDKGGSSGRVTTGVRSGGTNRGKLHITGSKRYVAHAVKQGQ